MGWLLRLLFAMLAWTALPVAADERPGCDSCLIRVDRLDEPIPLAGQWLFTREDDPSFARPDLDTAPWVLLRTPGSWNKAYGDGQLHRIGWYRGQFRFAPELLGQEVVLLINAYMSPVSVYLQGEEIFRRPDSMNIERYYALQPIPVRFRITEASMVLAIRIDTTLMTGVYQLPFELRRYDPHDRSLAFYQFWGGELRVIVGYVLFFFGLFFGLVYAKTRIALYRDAALTALAAFVFYGIPGDYFLRIADHQLAFALHYVGLFTLFPGMLFCQRFDRMTPRLNWALGSTYGALALAIPLAVAADHLAAFQAGRNLFLLLGQVCMVLAFYHALRGARAGQPGARVLSLGAFLMLASGIHDIVLALGLIASVTLTFVGGMAFLASILYVASTTLANTYIENQQLVARLGALNDQLEQQVTQRTAALARSLDELKQAQASLVEAEKLASLGALVAGVAHELNTPIGNALTSADALREHMEDMDKSVSEGRLSKSRLASFLASGKDIAALVVRSCERAAALISSFKRVAVDQTSEQRRTFDLEALVNDVLASLGPSLRGARWRIVAEVPAGIVLDSYPGALGQVITNIVQNAGVHAFEERDAGTLTLRARQEEAQVELRLEDDGRGMDATTCARIFDPFFTTRLGRGGSGLGLSISRNLVTGVLGGSLSVSSRPGEGSCFLVRLPVQAPVAPLSASRGP